MRTVQCGVVIRIGKRRGLGSQGGSKPSSAGSAHRSRRAVGQRCVDALVLKQTSHASTPASMLM